MSQKKINAEIDGARILRMLIRFRTPASNLLWTIEMMAYCAKMPEIRASAAIKWAVKNGYIVHQHREYLVTDDGRDYCDGAAKRPHFGSTDGASFKDEVLSGLTEHAGPLGRVTDKTTLTTPVLPTIASVMRTTKSPEDLLYEKYRLARSENDLAMGLDLGLPEYRELQRQGRIKICKGGVANHIGIFDKRGEDGHQHRCRACRQIARGKNGTC